MTEETGCPRCGGIDISFSGNVACCHACGHEFEATRQQKKFQRDIEEAQL